MRRTSLVATIDAVSKRLFAGPVPTEVPIEVLVSERANSTTVLRVWDCGAGNYVELDGIAAIVLAPIYALVLEGVTEFTPTQILRKMGYSCPTSRTAIPLQQRIGHIIRMLARIEVEISDAAGWDVKAKKIVPWLSYVPRTSLLNCEIIEDADGEIELIRLRPDHTGDPVTALPLLSRAREAGQVISITQDMLPAVRQSLEMRAMALELMVRGLQRLPNRRLLVAGLLRYIGFEFEATDAGRHAKHRAIAAMRRMLDALVVNGRVISGYELVFEDDGRRLRAVDLVPAHKASQGANSPSRKGDKPSRQRDKPSCADEPDIEKTPVQATRMTHVKAAAGTSGSSRTISHGAHRLPACAPDLVAVG